MKHFLILITFIFSQTTIFSQSDNQWYVKNNYGISSYNESTRTFEYLNGISSNTFYLDSVSHPQIQQPPKNYRNDLFIIYKNGENFYNGRYDPINVLKGLPNNFGYNVSNNSKIVDYLYFSNLYETDDPPGRVVINNGSKATCTNVNLTNFNKFGTNSFLSTNHDLVPGKDVTLIVNNKDINCGTYEINYNPIDLKLNNIFYNSLGYSYHIDGVTSTTLGKININKDVVTNDPIYHFFNFKVLETTNSNSSFSISTQYSNCPQFLTNMILTENISSMYHDPNYVQVKCVYKDASGQPWVKYRVQAYNDGQTTSEVYIKFDLNLPNSVNPNSIIVCDWNHGGSSGCGLGLVNKDVDHIYTVSDNLTTFAFRSNLNKVKGTGGHHNPNKCQMAWIEFCAKIRNGDPKTVDLQPSVPISNFSDGTSNAIYSITNFYDECTNKDDKGVIVTDACERKLELNCGCTCLKKKKLLGLF